MEEQKKEFHFDFGVYYITEEQAKRLFNQVIELVELMDAYVGGGYREYAEAEETTKDGS